MAIAPLAAWKWGRPGCSKEMRGRASGFCERLIKINGPDLRCQASIGIFGARAVSPADEYHRLHWLASKSTPGPCGGIAFILPSCSESVSPSAGGLSVAIMSTFDKQRFHALIKQEKSWFRMPSMVRLYLLMLARKCTPAAGPAAFCS